MVVGATGAVNVIGYDCGLTLNGTNGYGDKYQSALLEVEEGGCLSIDATESALKIQSYTSYLGDMTAEDVISLPKNYLPSGYEIVSIESEYSAQFNIVNSEDVEGDVSSADFVSNIVLKQYYETEILADEIEDMNEGEELILDIEVKSSDEAELEGNVTIYLNGNLETTIELSDNAATYTVTNLIVGTNEIEIVFTSHDTSYMSSTLLLDSFEVSAILSDSVEANTDEGVTEDTEEDIEEDAEEDTTEDTTDGVDTSDSTNALLFIEMLLLSLFGIVVFNKKVKA